MHKLGNMDDSYEVDRETLLIKETSKHLPELLEKVMVKVDET